ncbi:MAG: heavy metal-binding domain-containing protein [Methylotenera sp.]|nr:heavy metal-binding domain-containing protein [Oligoflexia bacterium]
MSNSTSGAFKFPLPPGSTPSPANSHGKVTGLSGNEIYCLSKMGMTPGNLCIGNSVFSLGVLRSLTSGLKILSGGEIPEITKLIHEGRQKAFTRMTAEAHQHGGLGITGASSELVNHGSNIEFLSIGSVVHQKTADKNAQNEKMVFSSSATAQELYCQMDSGFQPVQFVFGNVAYSIGVGGNIGGFFSSLKRGEVVEYSRVFDQTRHLALTRITDEARRCHANAVVGIETTITPFMGAQEMLMMGTASNHPSLANYSDNPVTSDMTNEELWNMVNLGYLPLRLVMGVSVYSLGFAGGLKAAFQSLGRGEIETMTHLIYEAREKALERIQRDAQKWGADEVVGVKTHVYDLGGGLIEFLAIGTAVKKVEGVTTKNENLPPQAIIRDRDTYFEGEGLTVDLGKRGASSSRSTQRGPIAMIFGFMMFVFYIFLTFMGHHK